MRERERWPSRTAFVVAAIGSAVGLGNLWRFPYIAYKNGGGAFFIPYFVALLTAGIPLMILEYGLGQRFQAGAPDALGRIRGRFRFLGWWALLIAAVISIYYAVVMAWCWLYTYSSITAIFHGGLPWAGIESDFFTSDILDLESPTPENPFFLGSIRWPIVAGLAITWLLVHIIIHKGVNRVGKIVMVTVPLPVILLAVLMLRSITLDGALDGIRYYLTPDWTKLSDPRVWLDAYSQIFFSLTLGFGVLIAYASYQPKNGDIVNNAFMTSLANCATSFFAGFVVFSTLGFLAFQRGVPVADVAAGGPGLAFVTYPSAIAVMPGGPLVQAIVGILFFVTLLSLGIDSLFSLVEGVVTAVEDESPRIPRWLISAVFCAASFLVGILICTQSGLVWLDILDHWTNSYGLAVVGLLECVAVGYFFDIAGFREDISSVSEIKLGRWWDDFIRIVTPGALIMLIVLSVHEEYLAPYEGYPPASIAVAGWGMIGLTLVLSLLFSRFRAPLLLGAVGIFSYLVFALKLDFSASMTGALAFAVLFGGLFICIRIASRSGRS